MKKRVTEVLLNYFYNVATVLSQAINTIVFLGDPDESLSSRIGKSVEAGGWASRVPWPGFVRRHLIRSIERDRGDDGALTRDERW